MSPNAPGSHEPTPALSTPAPQPPQEFDLLAFWIMHRRLVIRIVIAALLAVTVWGAWLFMDYRRRAGSEDALGNAKTAADFRKVTTEWTGTPAAGTAFVRLAEELRKEGKPADAAQSLRDFLEKYPLHPLRIPAAHALASSLETAGKFDEALAAYQQFGASYGRSSFAPLAYIGQARVLLALNRQDEARKVLEGIEQKFTGNPLMEEANVLLDEIKNPAARKTGGSPRPTPAPTIIFQGATPAPPTPRAAAPAMSITPAPAPAAPGVALNIAPTPAPAVPAPTMPAPPAPAPVPAPPAPAPAVPAPAVPAPAVPAPAVPALTAPAPANPPSSEPAPAK